MRPAHCISAGEREERCSKARVRKLLQRKTWEIPFPIRSPTDFVYTFIQQTCPSFLSPTWSCSPGGALTKPGGSLFPEAFHPQCLQRPALFLPDWKLSESMGASRKRLLSLTVVQPSSQRPSLRDLAQVCSSQYSSARNGAPVRGGLCSGVSLLIYHPPAPSPPPSGRV